MRVSHWVQMYDDTYFRIENSDHMPVFLMSIVSAYDHWLFVASNGGLTAGRSNADHPLFPYETEDKIAAHRSSTGSTTIVRASGDPDAAAWEPFCDERSRHYAVQQNLYKNISGTALVLEEENLDLGLRFRIHWRTGDRFGFVRTCRLENLTEESIDVEILDGVQNVMPPGATKALQTAMSSLLDAYKRSELDAPSGVGIFSLSATLTDRAEPSESLLATVVWQTGLDNPVHLLSRTQISSFCAATAISGEQDICGGPGAYLASTGMRLAPGEQREWYVVADVDQDGARVADLCTLVAERNHDELAALIEADVTQNAVALSGFVASVDGLQQSSDLSTTAHHFANVMFNIMRGGLPDAGCTVAREDLTDFVRVRNTAALRAHRAWFDALPARLELTELYQRAHAVDAPDLTRLCYEYLPITFSRRHGDPSRPWNTFSINIKHPDGSPRLDYQGNWRDIFQNWEPLVFSYPVAVRGVIAKFLNATSVDGYNPYRVTRDGIEWEIPEPENPWSNIGYWSDHQIIYLLKLLEAAETFSPGTFEALATDSVFSTAAVPYRIRPYHETLADWSDTIEFDWASQRAIEEAARTAGTDARLHRDADGAVVHVTMSEKLLILMLAKLANLVPGGGIWMNTQRPEWNDANNALVGKGLSVVTAAYLYRFVTFWRGQLSASELKSVDVTPAVARFCGAVETVLERYQPQLHDGFDGAGRRSFMDAMGAAATTYRSEVYSGGVAAERTSIAVPELARLLDSVKDYLEQTLRANRRDDALYHSYNILSLGEGTANVETLYLMLEGQVAILSAGILSSQESVDLLQALRTSALYRADQHSYMLYPHRQLPGFRAKNTVAAARLDESPLLARLVEAGDRRLVGRDGGGALHFNGHFRNADDVKRVLDDLATDKRYGDLVESDRATVLGIFEQTFQHRDFTGRSGTFFAYEGLGSIYWHMVSKLLLAVQECYGDALRNGAPGETRQALADAYYDVRAGIGFNKEAEVYGAFPTDPYSHSPWRSGARQPGMTGQVKEEILTRWGELGVAVSDGRMSFAPTLLCEREFSANAGTFEYVDLTSGWAALELPPDSLAFTYCQVPIIYTLADGPRIEVERTDGSTEQIAGDTLTVETTREIMERTGAVRAVRVALKRGTCRVCG